MAFHAIHGIADAVGHPVFHVERYIDLCCFERYGRAIRSDNMEYSGYFFGDGTSFIALLGFDLDGDRRFHFVDIDLTHGTRRWLAARAVREIDAGKLA